MADVEQSGSNGGFTAMRASLDRTLAFAEWADQLPPPSEPGTAAMTVNEMLNKIVGELARIAACYDLKEAAERFQDIQVMSGEDDPDALAYYDEAEQNIKDAMKRLGCPGAS